MHIFSPTILRQACYATENSDILQNFREKEWTYQNKQNNIFVMDANWKRDWNYIKQKSRITLEVREQMKELRVPGFLVPIFDKRRRPKNQLCLLGNKIG